MHARLTVQTVEANEVTYSQLGETYQVRLCGEVWCVCVWWLLARVGAASTWLHGDA